MSKVKMWTHNCTIQGKISVAVGCACDWCGAYQSAESTYCKGCGLLANELHDGLCACCFKKTTTIYIDNSAPLGVEAADVNNVQGYREVTA